MTVLLQPVMFGLSDVLDNQVFQYVAGLRAVRFAVPLIFDVSWSVG